MLGEVWQIGVACNVRDPGGQPILDEIVDRHARPSGLGLRNLDGHALIVSSRCGGILTVFWVVATISQPEAYRGMRPTIRQKVVVHRIGLGQMRPSPTIEAPQRGSTQTDWNQPLETSVAHIDRVDMRIEIAMRRSGARKCRDSDQTYL